jgi:hypothetical protein
LTFLRAKKRKNISSVKPIFQERISNFEINLTCVKFKKKEKEYLRQKLG